MNTQDGWDWPNGCTDERWPAPSDQPAPQPAWCATCTSLGFLQVPGTANFYDRPDCAAALI